MKKIVSDFDTTIENLLNPNILDFGNFKRNILTVVIMYHLKRGVLQYHSLYTNLNDEINKNKFKIEIEREIIKDNTKMDLINEFKQNQGKLFCKIKACGCCDVKYPDKGEIPRFQNIKVKDLDMLVNNAEQRAIIENEKKKAK